MDFSVRTAPSGQHGLMLHVIESILYGLKEGGMGNQGRNLSITVLTCYFTAVTVNSIVYIHFGSSFILHSSKEYLSYYWCMIFYCNSKSWIASLFLICESTICFYCELLTKLILVRNRLLNTEHYMYINIEQNFIFVSHH